jgi:hypothetical protein
MQNNAEAVSSKQPPAQPVILGPFCDRMVMTATISVADLGAYAIIEQTPPDELLKFIASSVVMDISAKAGNGYKMPKKKTTGYDTGQKCLGASGGILNIGVSRPDKKNPHIRAFRFELNPNFFQEPGLQLIEEEFGLMVLNVIPFDLILSKAKITSMHVAIDLLNVAMTDLLFRIAAGKKSLNPKAKTAGKIACFFSRDSELQTYSAFNDGKRKRSIFTAYNKAQERRDAGETLDCDGDWVRIERKLNNQKNVSLKNLHELSNPFATLSLQRISEVAPELGGAWQLFIDSTQRRGLVGALELVDPALREIYLEVFLSGGDATFWSSDALWSCWSDQLYNQGLLKWCARSLAYKPPSIPSFLLTSAAAQVSQPSLE